MASSGLRGLDGCGPWAAEDRRWAMHFGGRRGSGSAAETTGMEEGGGDKASMRLGGGGWWWRIRWRGGGISRHCLEKKEMGEGRRGEGEGGLAGTIDSFWPAGEASSSAVGQLRRWIER